MALTTEPGGTVTSWRTDACRRLNGNLRRLDNQLRSIVDAYQEKPSAIDDDLLNATDQPSVTGSLITEIYRVMKTYVYAEGSSFPVDDDLWEAFLEQEDEFTYFYNTTLMAIETYCEVLRVYSLLKGEVGPRPRHGDLELIRQDKRAQAEERAKCIEAISNFQSKLSAILIVLFSMGKLTV